MRKDAPRIAIVRLSALGDIVNSAIVLQLISQHYPNARIEWFCEEVFAPLLRDHPLIYRVHAVTLKRLKKSKSVSQLKALITSLRAHGEYDYVIDMQGLIKSAIIARLLGKNVHGFDRHSIREKAAAFLYASSSAIAYEANVVTRNTAVVADALGFTCNDDAIENKTALFPLQARPASLVESINIAIIVGASWPSKQYPKAQLAKVCSKLNLPCHLIWGNESERHDAEWIAQQAPLARVAESMNLKALLNFIAHCNLCIGGDTGPTHMAWAMNRPSITLFGPTTPRMMVITPINIAMESSSTVDINRINKNDFSIGDIPVETIVQNAKELL